MLVVLLEKVCTLNSITTRNMTVNDRGFDYGLDELKKGHSGAMRRDQYHHFLFLIFVLTILYLRTKVTVDSHKQKS